MNCCLRQIPGGETDVHVTKEIIVIGTASDSAWCRQTSKLT